MLHAVQHQQAQVIHLVGQAPALGGRRGATVVKPATRSSMVALRPRCSHRLRGPGALPQWFHRTWAPTWSSHCRLAQVPAQSGLRPAPGCAVARPAACHCVRWNPFRPHPSGHAAAHTAPGASRCEQCGGRGRSWAGLHKQPEVGHSQEAERKRVHGSGPHPARPNSGVSSINTPTRWPRNADGCAKGGAANSGLLASHPTKQTPHCGVSPAGKPSRPRIASLPFACVAELHGTQGA